jgi:Tfp pilus assembly protein PilV
VSEAGYTLAETLAALVMIGLAVGGLTEGVRALTRSQAATARVMSADRGLRGTETGLTRLLDGQGPFTTTAPNGFSGSATRFTFACGAAATCGAALVQAAGGAQLSLTTADGSTRTALLPGVRGARFAYADALGSEGGWPVSDPQPRTLRTIALMQATLGGETPVATVRLWVEQPTDCAFDPVSQDCRAVAR